MDAIDADVVIKYRGVEPDDINFILNSWMKSHRASKWPISNELYYTGQQRLIGALADRATLVVCCDGKPGQSHFIYGYACGEMDVKANILTLHYIYVKQGYRMVGIGHDLLGKLGWRPQTIIVATHWTAAAATLAPKYNAQFSDYPITLGNQHD